ncbi:uncharacterized protein PV09_04667 [Verruconis gallopava]|uniref:Major facilitator superfamily (MFS) profile domain-containing protein n=1 Tax=Verruconis gallopava TaxID=253628 RepID=A0A0D2AC06_9PEZI|nr:uncharacterized protein PV09_04667 [Verruconis gallopava]KIW04383.1 hypothetical protein PV09_04667 [Verruconis gallopava]
MDPEKVAPTAEHIDATQSVESLSDEHREYLIRRHGTAELSPLPDMNDANPYNWRLSKKLINLLLVAFHGLMSTFTAASIQSAFHNIAVDLGVSIQRASYLTSLVIAILGGAPVFWKPLSDRYGRRPIFLISLVGSLIGNVACAKCHSYATMGLCRAITAFFICPAGALGSAVVSECFFKHQRARYMGMWTVMISLGVPTAPLIFGFVATRVGYRWIYWVLAITNGVQFLLYLIFGHETRYVPGRTPTSLFKFKRIDTTPLTLWDFIKPFTFVYRMRVMIPAFSYSMVFLLAGVFITIEIPQLFVEQFGFNAEQIGLQNIAIIIGTLIGEQIGGSASDQWMAQRRKKVHNVKPEYRLWLSYPGYVLATVGIIVFLVQLNNAGQHWNVTPLVGAGIAAAGMQIVTTVLVTYAVDCYPKQSSSVGTFITFVRQTWGFIGPFWFPPMLRTVGLDGSCGITTALIIVGSVIPTIAIQWSGRKRVIKE